MKKLHSLAFYALVTPAITLGSGAVLAQQTADQDLNGKQQDSQYDKSSKYDKSSQYDKSNQSDQGAMQSTTNAAKNDQKPRDPSNLEKRGYMDAVPAKGMQATDLIGAEVKTTNDDVGSVVELIIDESGQVVAVVVGVGGFLGMGEKDVAISWDKITRSGSADEMELRIDLTREELRSAPEFERNE